MKGEFEAGQKMLADLEQKKMNLEQTMLRISGAIQVLEEMLAADPAAVAPAANDARTAVSERAGMTGNLDEAIAALLKDALPGLLGGAQPPVTLSVQSDTFATDPNAADALASEARPDDFSDQFAFDPAGIVFRSRGSCL